MQNNPESVERGARARRRRPIFGVGLVPKRLYLVEFLAQWGDTKMAASRVLCRRAADMRFRGYARARRHHESATKGNRASIEADGGNDFVRCLALHRHPGSHRNLWNRRHLLVGFRNSCRFEIRSKQSFGRPRFAVEARGPRFASEG
jgi:hypothetical protein